MVIVGALAVPRVASGPCARLELEALGHQHQLSELLISRHATWQARNQGHPLLGWHPRSLAGRLVEVVNSLIPGLFLIPVGGLAPPRLDDGAERLAEALPAAVSAQGAVEGGPLVAAGALFEGYMPG